jgi:hypothetical protein
LVKLFTKEAFCSPDAVFSWICYVAKILVGEPEVSEGVIAPLSEHVRHSYGTKPANRDQRTVYVEQLSRITGFGEDKARALADKYPSMNHLVAFLRGTLNQQCLVAAFKDMKIGLGPHAAKYAWMQLLHPEDRPWQWVEPTKRKRSPPPQKNVKMPKTEA